MSESLLSTTIELERVLALYETHRQDLVRLRRYQRLLHDDRYDGQRASVQQAALSVLADGLLIPTQTQTFTSAQFDDLEAELTYLLLRDERPSCVVEVSPHGGWSTSWILNALQDNGHGKVHSYDLIDQSLAKIPKDLAMGYHYFYQGDVRQSEQLPDSIDYLFLDSDHSAEFGHWAVERLFPRVRSGGTVSVHDVFHTGGVAASGGEGPIIINWLEKRDIPFFTMAPSQNAKNYDTVHRHRANLGIQDPIGSSETNPALFFVMP